MAISEKVCTLIHSNKTLTAAFATATADPDNYDVSPGRLARVLYDEHAKKHHSLSGSGHLEAFKGLFQHTPRTRKDVERIQAIEPTQEDIDLAAQCGDFGSRPSDLFLKASAISHRLLWTAICINFRYTWTFWPRSTAILGLVSCPHLFWAPEGS